MLLYHYCSNDTFLKIIESSELRLSELTLSNDSMEGAWIWESQREECRLREIPTHDIDIFEKNIRKKLEQFLFFGFCMSEHRDVLSQWRGYAANGTGVTVGFDADSIEKISNKCIKNSVMHQIIYGRPYVHWSKKLDLSSISNYNDALEAAFEESIGINADAIEVGEKEKELIENYLFIVKNPAFSEEKEWRIIASIHSDEENGCATIEETAHKVNNLGFSHRDDKIVPHLTMKIPGDKKGCIKEVILGPRNRTPKPVIRAVLEKYGFHNVDIEPSTATYR